MERNELLQGPAKSTGVSLPTVLLNAVRERAKELDRSVSWLMKEALAAYLAEDTLKVYICTGHIGHWPTGTASVVVAASETEAARLLGYSLEDMGLKPNEPLKMRYVPTDRRSVEVLCDGDY